jgi:hypothetical protein
MQRNSTSGWMLGTLLLCCSCQHCLATVLAPITLEVVLLLWHERAALQLLLTGCCCGTRVQAGGSRNARCKMSLSLCMQWIIHAVSILLLPSADGLVTTHGMLSCEVKVQAHQ